MERVTKKAPPHTVKVHIFLNDRVSNATLVVSNNNQQQSNSTKQQQQQQLESLALGMAQSFAPVPGQGRIFIGFRTSQTTGLGAHVAAPFVPTVEREAMDLQDAVLSVYNTDLLEFSGLVLRLTLEHCMRNVIDVAWQAGKAQRDALEAALRLEMLQRNKQSPRTNAIVAVDSTVGEHAQLDKADSTDTSSSSSSKGLMSFALYMAR